MFNTKIITLVRVCFENRFWTVGAATPLVLVPEPLLGVKLHLLDRLRTGRSRGQLRLHEGLGAAVVEVGVGADGVPVLVAVLGQDIPVGVHLPLQFIIGHPATGGDVDDQGLGQDPQRQTLLQQHCPGHPDVCTAAWPCRGQ